MRPVHAEQENHGALRYLGQGLPPEAVAAGPPPEDVDRWRLGAHPDVVEWLWERLNPALPADGRYLVAGGPALVAPSGVLIAAGLGTQYALRLDGTALEEASAAGFSAVHTFRTVDRTLDLATTFGSGWRFGRFDEREPGWLVGSAPAVDRG
ncbi:MAG: hypothetical protein ACRDHD_09640 [Candidatus Limnocylindria bacterium]